MANRNDLPQVAGEMECSIAQFEYRCRVWLGKEQAKIAPDNALIALICDAARLSRAHCDLARTALTIPIDEPSQQGTEREATDSERLDWLVKQKL